MHQDDWDRILGALFKAGEPDERFVARVMARVNESAEVRGQRTEVRNWTAWLTPALGFAFAGWLLFYARPQQAETESFPDAAVQADGMQDLEARWVYTEAL